LVDKSLVDKKLVDKRAKYLLKKKDLFS